VGWQAVGNRGIAPARAVGFRRRALYVAARFCREAHFWRHNSPVWGESMAMPSVGVDTARGPRTVRGLDRSGGQQVRRSGGQEVRRSGGQESGVRSQEAWAGLAASLTRRSQLAPRHFFHEHLFTQSYASRLLENNWPDSERPRFSWSLELPRSRQTFVQKHPSNLARARGGNSKGEMLPAAGTWRRERAL
jgi:hypothetical protein